MTYIPSKGTKIIYSLSLVMVILIIALPRLQYALRLFQQMPNNSNIVNPIIAVLYTLVGLVVIAVAVHRIYEIAVGYVTLSSLYESSFIKAVRILGILFMYIGCISIILGMFFGFFYASLFGAFYGSLIGLVVGFFKPLSLIGLILFEFSRIRSFEYSLEYDEDEIEE